MLVCGREPPNFSQAVFTPSGFSFGQIQILWNWTERRKNDEGKTNEGDEKMDERKKERKEEEREVGKGREKGNEAWRMKEGGRRRRKVVGGRRTMGNGDENDGEKKVAQR